MDFCELIDAHIESRADITIAAQPVDAERRDRRWASSASTTRGQIVGFEEKPDAARLAEMRSSVPRGRPPAAHRREAVRRVDGHLRVLARGAARHPRAARASTSARRSFRTALGNTQRATRTSIRGYWADVGTIEAFYDANIQLTRRGAPFNFFHPHCADLHAPALPAGDARVRLPRSTRRSSRKAATSISCEISRIGRRHPHARRAPARASRGRCCSAPTSTRTRCAASAVAARHRPRRRARSRDRRQERAHRRRRAAGQRRRRRRTPTATATTSATASSSCRRAPS